MSHQGWFSGSRFAGMLSSVGRKSKRRRPNSAKPAESLESRLLLTVTNMGAINGTVFNDLTDNGQTGDDVPLAGATLELYLDGGDLTFNSGGGDDTALGTTTSVAGLYSFTGLSAGRYFVRQQALAGFIQQPGEDVVTVDITVAQAAGTAGTIIDDFSTPAAGQDLSVVFPGTPTASSAIASTGAIGGQREMFLEATAGNISFQANNAAFPGSLNYNANFGATGRASVIWDGSDGLAAVDPVGLGGIDLTAANETGFLVSLGTSANITVTIIVHTDATSSSIATVPFAASAVDTTFIPYSTFGINGGATAVADFSNVGAIEFRIEAPAATTTTVSELLQSHAPTFVAANFANFVPMTLGDRVFNDLNNDGQFSSATESGINGVALTLFDDTNNNNTFDSGTDLLVATTTTAGGGLYSFANLFPGDYIVQVDSSNFSGAGVLAGFQSSTGNGVAPDPDGNLNDDDNGTLAGSVVVSQAITLANNGEPTNDGDADNNTNLSLDFGFFAGTDLVVTKTANAATIIAGSGAGNLVYTVTISNAGLLGATGVTVTDTGVIAANLPAGVTFVSAVGSGTTTFNTTTGVWTVGSLAPAASATLTVTLTVDATASDSLVINNTASLTTLNETDSDSTNNSQSTVTNVDRRVDIAVTKVNNINPVIAGSGAGNLIYTITATNQGPSDASGVTLSDTDILAANLPAGVTLVSAVGSGGSTFDTTTGVWTIGSLVSSASRTLVVTLTVGASASDSLVLNNTATLATVNETDTNALNNTQSVATNVDRSVDIAVTKVENINPVIAGSGVGNLVYTVTATNTGPSDASGVVISDLGVISGNLPAGVTFVSATGSGSSTFNATTGLWTIGNLTTGDNRTLTITLTVGATASDSLVITNTATLNTVNETDSNLTNNTQTIATNVDRSVDIVVTKSGTAGPIIAGSGTGNLVYVITAMNSGPSNASGVVIDDSDILTANLPAGVTLVSAVGSGTSSFSTTTGLWTIGDLDVGSSRTLIVTLTVSASAADTLTLTNTATLDSVNETDSQANNNTQQVTTEVDRRVDIAVTKVENINPVIAGSGIGNLVYTVTATNNGPSNASGVALSDIDILAANLPAGVTLVSATGSGSSTYSSTTGLWTIGDLDPGASRTLTVVLTVAAGASDTLVINNTASLSTVNETDTNANNNSQSVATAVDRRVDIAIAKINNINPVIAGSGAGNLVYTVTATNNGPSNASGVTITDVNVIAANLPAGVTFVSGSGTGGSTFNTTTGLWTIGNLDSGVSRTLTLTFTVGASASDSLVINNTATLTTVNEVDTVANNNSQSVATNVDRRIDIAVTKAQNVNTIIAGNSAGNLIYTVTATNTGPSDASGVVIRDLAAIAANLPTGVTLVSSSGTGGSTFSSTTGLWTIGALTPGESRTLTITLTVGASASDTLVMTNTAELFGSNETDANAANNSQTVTANVDRSVDIVVTKVNNAPVVIAGSGTGNLVYTITATNAGPSDASGVTIIDTGALAANLPAGVTLVSAVGSNGSTYNTTTGIWTIGTLARGTGRSLTITLTVGSTTAHNQVINNTATLQTVTEVDSNATNNTQTVTSRVERSVDVAITKADSSDPAFSPGRLTYTIVITNNGPSQATGVVMSDTLASGTTFISSTSTLGTITHSGGVITANITALNAGASATFTIVTSLNLPSGGNLLNIASVRSTETDSNLGNNSASELTTVEPTRSSISGNVFQDLNSNQLRDNGELALSSVSIVLFGVDIQGTNVVRRTSTNTAGAYSFTNLLPGTYTVYEMQPNFYLDSSEVAGTPIAATVAQDSFVNLALTGGVTAVNFNFTEGVYDNSKRPFLASSSTTNQQRIVAAPVAGGTGSVSGTVAVDSNRSGTLDTGDIRIPAAVVTLAGLDNAGNPVIIHRTTDTSGNYQFGNLPAGQYSVIETQPIRYADGPEQMGSLLPDETLDDLFALMSLADGTAATGFNFLELPITAASTVPNILTPASTGASAQPTVSWTPVDGAVSYEIQINQVTGGVGTVVSRTGITGTSWAVTTKLALGNHRVWVRAVNAAGVAGAWSLPVSFTAGSVATTSLPGRTSIDTTPVFDWTDIAGATSYDLKVTNIGTGQTVLDLSSLTTSTYTATTALPVGNYRYFVRGRNADVTGNWSPGHEFSVSGAPTTRTTLRLTTPTPTLQWDPVSGAVRYDIWLDDLNGTAPAQITTVSTSATNALSVPVALDLGNYRYYVRAVDAAGNRTAWSTPSTFTVAAAPTLLTPVTNTNDTTPTFTWTAVPGATRYDLWVSNRQTGLFVREQNVVGTSHTFTTVFPAANYRVWVQAIGANGTGAWSQQLDFTVHNIAAPTLNGPPATTSNVRPPITWTSSAGAVRYELWVDRVGGPAKVIHLTNLTATAFTPTANLSTGTYRAWVRAINSVGVTSNWSSLLQFTIV